MLRTKKKQLNLKPNRVLDKRSSRGMLYENEELRLRTIHINDEVDKGHTDIKKLRKENEYLKREIWSLRDECSKLEDVLKKVYSGNPPPLSELPQYQPRVRKQSTFSGIWGGRRGSNMSFSNCSSYDYDIDIDAENHDNENDPDYEGQSQGQGQGDDILGGGYDSQGYPHHKKITRQISNTNSLQQDTNSLHNYPASNSNSNSNTTTHVNWEDQQQVDIHLEPGSNPSASGSGIDDLEGTENIENLQNQKDYSQNQQVIVPHGHHNHNNPWQMHSPDLEAVTEESENASNSNNSNPTSQVLPIPNPGEILNLHSNSNSNSNASSMNNLHNFIHADNDSALFEALEFESMNCSMERLHTQEDPHYSHSHSHYPHQNQHQHQHQHPQRSISVSNTNINNFDSCSQLNVNIERASSSNSFFHPIIEITPALSSPTSTIVNGNDGRRASMSPGPGPGPVPVPIHSKHLQGFDEERPNSNVGPNQHQHHPPSYQGNSESISDSYHDLGCVTEIPKKYQVTSELKITSSGSQSSSVDHIPGLPDAPNFSNSNPNLNISSQSADRRAEQVSGSGSALAGGLLRYPFQNLSSIQSKANSVVGGDDSVSQSQPFQNQNQICTVGNTNTNSHNRDLAPSEASNNKPVPASYRVLKIYSTYLSKTQRRHSTSKNNSTSFSQSEPNLNSQDIFQFQSHHDRDRDPQHANANNANDHEQDDFGGGISMDSGWGPRNGQLTCRKLQGWSRSCCHTSTICQCHSNSRTNLNPFEMCSCNCAGENPHLNLKDDWNIFDRNIVIGMLDEDNDKDKDKDNDSISPSNQNQTRASSLRYLSVQEVIDELESQFDSTLENAQGVRLLTLPDFYPCRVFISVRTAASVKILIEKGLTLRGQRMKLIDASQNAFSFIILSGLPLSFPDSSIISVLNEFGQVVAPLQRRAYRGVDTTERMARMHLVRIPPTSQIPLNIAGYEVLAKFVSQPSHEIPVSSVLSTANDMISTHAVLTNTAMSPTSTPIPGTIGTNTTTNTNTSTNPNTINSYINALQKNPNLSLLTTTTTTSDSGNGQMGMGSGGNKSPVLVLGTVPGTVSASPVNSSAAAAIPRPHKLVTRSTTLDPALAASAFQSASPGSGFQQQQNVQTLISTSTSRFGLGPTAAAISKRNMSICGSLLESSNSADNPNGGQKHLLLGNPKKPLSRLPRSSPGSLVPPSPGVGPGPGGQLGLGDGGLTAGTGGSALRPLSRSMSFEPRRASGNGKALNAGSQLSLVESHKLNQSNSFPLSDSIGSGNGLSRQQSRIYQQHRKLSQASSAHFQTSLDKKEELPWCGCWGNGCI